MIPTVMLLTVSLVLAQPVPSSQPASLPADTSEREGNRLQASAHDVHGLVRDEFPAGDGTPFLGTNTIGTGKMTADGKVYVFTSREIKTPFVFNDVIPSWNIDAKKTGFYVLLRLGRSKENFWTPYYYLGSWGHPPALDNKFTEDMNGEINIDYFQSRNPFDRLQYQIHARVDDPAEAPVIHRVFMAYSNTLDDADLAKRINKEVDPGPKTGWARRLPVPYRSQRWEDEKIRGSICSPTSTSMVMDYRGVKQPTVQVCKRVYDDEYKLYGSWWRAVQTAFSFGVPGYVERFGDWNAVKKHIAEGQPVIASIKVKRGQMRNAPYRQSAGHLIVIVGFTADGDVCVNDPAANGAADGQAIYNREDMEKVWLANGGIGYILEPLPKESKSAHGG